MTINVCRLMRDFPSLKGIEQVPTLNALAKEIEYAEYGLAPGIYSLMKEQVKLGACFNVIAANKEGLEDYEALEGIEVHRVRRPYNMNALLKMRKLDATIGIDIVHAHATSAFVYALLRRVMKRKPYVVHVHGTTAGVLKAIKASPLVSPKKGVGAKYRTWLSFRRQSLVWKKADRLIAVSNSIANELDRFYHIPSDKISVVFNGVDVQVFKPANEDLKQKARRKLGIQGKPVILNVGSVRSIKGLEYLLKAARKVMEEFPEAFFVVLGGVPKFAGEANYLQFLKKLSAALKLSRKVLFAGQVRHKDTLYYYMASDVFVFPSLHEGFAKALLEAMSCGLPIVATNVGGNKDAIIHEESGLLIDPCNADQIADALIRILSEAKLGRSLGLRARKRAEKYFTWKIAAKKIMAIYEELL